MKSYIVHWDLNCYTKYSVFFLHREFQNSYSVRTYRQNNWLLCFNKLNLFLKVTPTLNNVNNTILGGTAICCPAPFFYVFTWLSVSLSLSQSVFVLIHHLSGHVLTRCINSEPILHHIALALLSKYRQTLTLQIQLDSQPV